MVYEPREDSYLLAEQVKKYAYGDVLDVGTGSGIQAQTASRLQAVSSVEAVDLDEEAVAAAEQKNIKAYVSDMFESVTKMYDTIICNTPYLPDEPLAPDIALDGGPKGFEWTVKFLREAKSHLRAKGQILLLISTLTNTHVVEKEIQECAYKWELVASEKHSFEELLVYRIRHALPNRPEAKYLAKGKRSKVYLDEDVVIKVADTRRVLQEARMLEKINKLSIGPRLIGYDKDELYMQYIPGQRIDSYLETHTKEQCEKVLEDVQRQLRILDSEGINKSEMTNPYKHIIVDGMNPVLIDWERAKYSLRPQNNSQFNEYLKKKGYRHLIC